MKLSRDAFNLLHDALRDGFNDYDELALLSMQCHRPLPDITERTGLPIVIQRLIEDCATRDELEPFIDCMQHRYPENRLIAALRLGALTSAPSDEQVVDAGGGPAAFRQQLKETLGELATSGMHFVVADELIQLLDTASDREARTLYLATLGNLKVERDDATVRALVPVIGAALGRLLGQGRRLDVDLSLDRTRLRHIDLSGLDLHEADIAFADLRHANLDGANLWRSRGYAVDVSKAGLTGSNCEEARWHSAVAPGARFHNCRMISIVLKEADLAGAEFHRSRLQGAHFERARLSGAHFEQANLADAYFYGATIDDAAAASIARAENWPAAHFDRTAHDLVEKHASR